jgi:hypothetical protein
MQGSLMIPTVFGWLPHHTRRSGSGRLTLRELRRSDLLEALEALDQEDDINKVGLRGRQDARLR